MKKPLTAEPRKPVSSTIWTRKARSDIKLGLIKRECDCTRPATHKAGDGWECERCHELNRQATRALADRNRPTGDGPAKTGFYDSIPRNVIREVERGLRMFWRRRGMKEPDGDIWRESMTNFLAD